jgi:MoxR-like ATPase
MNKIQQIKDEVKKIVVGHENLIDGMLITLLSDGHLLVEGVPGVAKTTAINALAKSLGVDFKRIQFTPDLLPSDITGTMIYNQKELKFEVKKGPVFTNLLLADEINRAPAKVQSALLEVMQEKQVTIGEESFKLNLPFLVMATQNPVEQEGAYNLPEAQLDRFMMKINVGYNSLEEEFLIVNRIAKEEVGFKQIKQVASKEDLKNLKEEVKKVHIDDALIRYMLEIIFATRNSHKYLVYGASPRGSIDLFKASRARAYLDGKDYVTPLDIAKVAPEVLKHRLILNYKAISEGVKAEDIVKEIIDKVKAP